MSAEEIRSLIKNKIKLEKRLKEAEKVIQELKNKNVHYLKATDSGFGWVKPKEIEEYQQKYMSEDSDG